MGENEKNQNKMRYEKIIMNISLIGSILFMLSEGFMAYYTKSHSLLMDCIFDVTDLIMIGPFMVLVPLLYKPVTEKKTVWIFAGGVSLCSYQIQRFACYNDSARVGQSLYDFSRGQAC